MLNRLPNGSLSPLSQKTGFPISYLSDLVSTRKRPSRKRALSLEQASSAIGKTIPAATWLLGSKDEIREALLNGKQACYAA